MWRFIYNFRDEGQYDHHVWEYYWSKAIEDVLA